ncbi:hypothetical protein GCM10027590_06590 [Nocardiopsis nanhaiensis]
MGGQMSDEVADQVGGFASALVVAALLGRVGELFEETGASVAQLSGLVGVAEQVLYKGQSNQVGVGLRGW